MKLRFYWRNIDDKQNKHIFKIYLLYRRKNKVGKGECQDLG